MFYTYPVKALDFSDILVNVPIFQQTPPSVEQRAIFFNIVSRAEILSTRAV
jgi:hypothetical protein